MATRFLARIDRKACHDDASTNYGTARFREAILRHGDLDILIDHGSLILAAKAKSVLRCGAHGVILGSLFLNGGREAIEILSQADQQKIAVSRGHWLTHSCWGPYLAVLHTPEEVRIEIIRAPMGELPCLILETDEAIFLASDVELLMALADYRPVVDWSETLRHLVHRDIHHSATCLAGVRELPGGDRLSIGSEGSIHDTLWTPWAFAERKAQIGNRNEAARLLRDTALDCIAARASSYERVLLTLSGGLDSSLVAACLSRQPTKFHALNLVTDDPNGDERLHARRVSEILGNGLTETFREVTRFDIRQSGARNLPRPCVRGFAVESLRLAHETARAVGADAIFNGGGGDNVFCSLQSGSPAADRLLVEGPGTGFLRTAKDMSLFAQASLPAVLGDALQRAWLGKPAFRLRPELDLLSPDAQKQTAVPRRHPWLVPPPGSLPGKAMHMRFVAIARSYVESLGPQAVLPIIAPLLSQPLVELCLRIPSWFWFEAGHNRMVARQAFADILPPDILLRRSKGTPDSFIAQIYETHRLAIRELLTSGELARRGLIDLPGVLRILDAPGPIKGKGFERLLQFVDVEVWAHGWAPGSTR